MYVTLDYGSQSCRALLQQPGTVGKCSSPAWDMPALSKHGFFGQTPKYQNVNQRAVNCKYSLRLTFGNEPHGGRAFVLFIENIALQLISEKSELKSEPRPIVASLNSKFQYVTFYAPVPDIPSDFSIRTDGAHHVRSALFEVKDDDFARTLFALCFALYRSLPVPGYLGCQRTCNHKHKREQ